MHIPWGEPYILSFEQQVMDIGCITDIVVVGMCRQNCLLKPSASMEIMVNGQSFPKHPLSPG